MLLMLARGLGKLQAVPGQQWLGVAFCESAAEPCEGLDPGLALGSWASVNPGCGGVITRNIQHN